VNRLDLCSQERLRRIYQLKKDADWGFGLVAVKRFGIHSDATGRIPAESRERI